MESEPNDSVLMLGTIPGNSPMKPMKLRLIDGRSTSSRPVMLPPTSFEVTSTSGESAETVDRLRHRSHFERDVERRGLAQLGDDVLAHEFLEALQLGADFVAAGDDAADDERAVGTGNGLAEHAGVLIPHGHRHSRQHRPLRVEHPAADFGGSLLRERRGDAEQRASIHALACLIILSPTS